MKIQRQSPHEDRSLESIQTGPTQRTGAVSGTASGSRARQVGIDRIDVSDLASTADRVMSITGQERESRVTRLAQAYQTGQYRVDPGVLSSAILNAEFGPGNGLTPIGGNDGFGAEL